MPRIAMTCARSGAVYEPYCPLGSNGMTKTHHDTAAPETVEREKYLRLAADFENYRKAMDQQLADVIRYGSAGTIAAVLDVGDHLMRAVAHAPEAIRSDEWFKGLQQTLDEFQNVLKKLGVVRIPTDDATFDPATMEAISTVKQDGGGRHRVKEELRAGYALNGRVLRPARVIIYE